MALHARTAAQRYSGEADWEAIAQLKEALDVPVLGNGDIWDAEDVVRMVKETGCDGVVSVEAASAGHGCSPTLQAAFTGRNERVMPNLGEVAHVMRRHAELLTEWWGAEREAVTDFRKHVAWYLKGFPVGSELRRAMAMSSSLSELDELLGKLDIDVPSPTDVLGQPRGRTNSPAKVVLPYGWLDDRDSEAVPEDAEHDDSGGCTYVGKYDDRSYAEY